MEVLCFRNLEADIALRSTAAVFTYCRSRGLFAGISLEGSYLIERKDTNRKYAEPPLEAPACFRHNVTFHLQVLLSRHPSFVYPKWRR